ncbi:MAG: hypothetical protein ACLQGP_27135 [Isosphaeraceae bacterium]
MSIFDELGRFAIVLDARKLGLAHGPMSLAWGGMAMHSREPIPLFGARAIQPPGFYF